MGGGVRNAALYVSEVADGYSVVVGGDSNTVVGIGASIGGGMANIIFDPSSSTVPSTIVGGVSNTVIGLGNTISGGGGNGALEAYGTIAGGIGNFVCAFRVVDFLVVCPFLADRFFGIAYS